MIDGSVLETTAVNEAASAGRKEGQLPPYDFKKDAIFNYGIDAGDRQNPTAKERVFFDLDALEKKLQQLGTEPDSDSWMRVVNEDLENLLAPPQSGEQVNVGDLLAAHDALWLRIKDLKRKGLGVGNFETRLKLLRTYLSSKPSIDLSEGIIELRLNGWAASLQRYSRGLPAPMPNSRFWDLSRRAASLYIYSGEAGTEPLDKIEFQLATYPEELSELAKVVAAEASEKGAIKVTPSVRAEAEAILKREPGNLLATVMSSAPRETAATQPEIRPSLSTTLREHFEGYQYGDLIIGEIGQAKRVLEELGLTQSEIAAMILTGSAVEKRLRTIEDNPQDASDLNLLVIVDESALRKLDALMQTRNVRLSRSRKASGATFYIVKRPSQSGRLEGLDIKVCSLRDMRKEKARQTNDKNQFIEDALQKGILI